MRIKIIKTWENFSFERQKLMADGKIEIITCRIQLSAGIKPVICVTDFGVSMAIITFFVGGTS